MEVSAVHVSDCFFITDETKPNMDDVFGEILKQVNLMLMKDGIETSDEKIDDGDERQKEALFYGLNPSTPGIYQNVIIVDDTTPKVETLSILPVNMADGEKITSEAIEELTVLYNEEIQTVGGNIMVKENTKLMADDIDKSANFNKKIDQETLSEGNVKKVMKIPKLAEPRTEVSVSKQDDLTVKTSTIPGSVQKSNALSESYNRIPEKVIPLQDNEMENSNSTDKVAGSPEAGYKRGEIAIMDIPGMRIKNISLTDNKKFLSRENINILKTEIVESIDLKIEGKVNVIEVELNPRELGKVHISLKLEEGRLEAKFLVKNENTKGILINSIDELSKSLKGQNIYIAKMEVNVKQDASGAGSYDLNSNFGRQSKNDHNTGKNHSRWRGTNNLEIQIQKDLDLKRGEVSLLA